MDRAEATVTSPAEGMTRDRAVAVCRRALVDAWFPKGSPEDLAEWDRIAGMDAEVAVDALAEVGALEVAED
jgi:uncharacterized protein YmfQ (DUF2313 family)